MFFSVSPGLNTILVELEVSRDEPKSSTVFCKNISSRGTNSDSDVSLVGRPVCSSLSLAKSLFVSLSLILVSSACSSAVSASAAVMLSSASGFSSSVSTSDVMLSISV